MVGEEIPFAVRIFTIVDVWDALTSDRPYRKAFSHEYAYEYLRNNSGTHFDPEILRVFLELIQKKLAEEKGKNLK